MHQMSWIYSFVNGCFYFFVCLLPVRDLTWQDLELVVERRPVPPNPRGLLDGVWPLAYGLLLGFSVALLVSVATLLLTVHICNSDRQQSTNWNRRKKSGHGLKGHSDRGLLTSIVTSSSELTAQELTETPLLMTSIWAGPPKDRRTHQAILVTLRNINV